MKHKGAVSDEQEYRNRYIFSEYQRLKHTCRFTSIGAIAKEISDHSSMPHHFLSFQIRRTAYYHFKKFGDIKHVGKYRSRLIRSFLKSCENVRTVTGLTVTTDIIEMANELPASCTGLSSFQIYRILTSMNAH